MTVTTELALSYATTLDQLRTFVKKTRDQNGNQTVFHTKGLNNDEHYLVVESDDDTDNLEISEFSAGYDWAQIVEKLHDESPEGDRFKNAFIDAVLEYSLHNENIIYYLVNKMQNELAS